MIVSTLERSQGQAQWLGGSSESQKPFDLSAHLKQWQSFKRKEIFPEAKHLKSALCLGMFAGFDVDTINASG